ncbi:hypothetical protein DCCM_0609 [Desulfocucumis palustris]|uniref:Uncharacterized protein n=1 Tax=Desulfocucumis palustris TaxID=1898651 RepID=A0A2L2X8C1_9FIRM|nr:hypothetical protein DCCM_0609 [Desulfocucumis palustris]
MPGILSGIRAFLFLFLLNGRFPPPPGPGGRGETIKVIQPFKKI